MSTPVIEFQAVHKSFRKKHVLSGMTLSVEQGKTFAFLGRNGAGKTTAIRILMGLLNSDSGNVSVLGHQPDVDPIALRQSVGYLAEDQTMYGWMRCDELLSFMAPFYPTWDHQLALKYAREFEVPLASKIKTLSKGQNVRLGLVLALAHRPEVVILDDPALGLDPIMRKQFNRDLVTHLQGEGRTIFYSSHLLYEVEPVADEVAILNEGRVLVQASTDTLRRDVKQVLISREDMALLNGDLDLLHRREEGDSVAVTVRGGQNALARFAQLGIEHRVLDLNLDEIFEAYVAGETARGSLQPEAVQPDPPAVEA